MLELSSQKDLGIDVQQIDDGYQHHNKGKSPEGSGWYPHKEKYPEGFKNVSAKAKQNDMKLSLWYAAMSVSLKEMKDNDETGAFGYYKLDFANVRNHKEIEDMVEKIWTYKLFTNHQSKVNWDVTENTKRFGYFWAKEYGNVILENRKPHKPENVVYIPHLVLRDLWHLSKYCNLNKFQGSIKIKT